MTAPRPLFSDESPGSEPDFSIVLGGPLFQLLRRSRLAGNALELAHRRVLVLTALAWLPLLILSVVEGRFMPGSIGRPFAYDIGLHIRLLVALPLLVMAELVVHRRMRPAVQQFLKRGLVPEASRARFDAALASAGRLRNSIVAELLLIALVYFVGLRLVSQTRAATAMPSWYGVPENGGLHLSNAGWWLMLVSLPLLQFLLLRWYFRLLIWGRFLWQVSRIDLSLVPTHPDRSGGLGFLTLVSYAFTPVLFAQGTMLTSIMANQIFFAGASLAEFKLELIGLVAVMVLAVLGPLLFFSPKLEATKRAGLVTYGTLAQRYVREFDRKWVGGEAPAEEALMGSADIQSLADLSNSFEVVKEMRWVPFTTQTVLKLSVTTLAPVVPLLLTMVPLEELVDRLLKIVF